MVYTSSTIISSIRFDYLPIAEAFYDAMSGYEVSLFILVTGSLTFSKTIDISLFYKKTFLKIFFPLFFWYFVYHIFISKIPILKRLI